MAKKDSQQGLGSVTEDRAQKQAFSEHTQELNDIITDWIYEAYKGYYQANGEIPSRYKDLEVLAPVFLKVKEADLDLPEYEIRNFYCRRKTSLRRKLRSEFNDPKL